MNKELLTDILEVEGINAKGYGNIPKLVMKDRRLSRDAKCIYAYFCSYAGQGTQAFPSVSLILHDLGISKSTYYKHLNLLKRYGYIETRQIKKSGKFSRNIYTLCTNPVQVTEDEEVLEASPCPKIRDTENWDTEVQDTEFWESNNNSNNINSINNNQSINQELGLIDGTNKNTTYTTYREIIAQNIQYDFLKRYRFKGESILDDIYELLVDAVTSTKKTIRVCGDDKPAEVVKSVFLKLRTEHIEYVIEAMKSNVNKINNIEAYLLTALYKAPMTINAFYTYLAQQDISY